MGKQCWSQAVLQSGSWGHSVLQTPALVQQYKNIHVGQMDAWATYCQKAKLII